MKWPHSQDGWWIARWRVGWLSAARWSSVVTCNLSPPRTPFTDQMKLWPTERVSCCGEVAPWLADTDTALHTTPDPGYSGYPPSSPHQHSDPGSAELSRSFHCPRPRSPPPCRHAARGCSRINFSLLNTGTTAVDYIWEGKLDSIIQWA